MGGMWYVKNITHSYAPKHYYWRRISYKGQVTRFAFNAAYAFRQICHKFCHFMSYIEATMHQTRRSWTQPMAEKPSYKGCVLCCPPVFGKFVRHLSFNKPCRDAKKHQTHRSWPIFRFCMRFPRIEWLLTEKTLSQMFGTLRLSVKRNYCTLGLTNCNVILA